ncbi:MAG: ATP-binding protein [Candidatus Electryonea clarkiae]|nr:ATP-binding protein [Candidatus Electryonea clarkiae]
MEDLSLHILDVVENSISAGAKKIEIKIRKDLKEDLLTIEIIDNGKGMDAEMLEKVLDPFFTTKTVRKVGLGLSLLREAARAANGDLTIQSEIGKGTRVKATFQHSHIDRKPMGDMEKTMISLIIGNSDVHFKYFHNKNGRKYRMIDTEKFKADDKLSSISTGELIHLVKKSLKEI